MSDQRNGLLSSTPPKLKTPALAVLFATVFINLVGFGLVVPLLPFFAATLDAAPWQITLMFSAYSLGQFFAEPFWGRLSDRIGRRQVVSCQQTDTDRYGRVVADCIVGRENLNRWMVREGWAVAYRQYSTAYIPAEDHARTGQRGIWQGRFDMPWDWRAERRSGQNAAPTMSRLYELAGQNWSCSPRRSCSQIGSCAEARWYLQNCPWGGKLDRDNDGIPCESIC